MIGCAFDESRTLNSGPATRAAAMHERCETIRDRLAADETTGVIRASRRRSEHCRVRRRWIAVELGAARLPGRIRSTGRPATQNATLLRLAGRGVLV
jgi:hypothetical protein